MLETISRRDFIRTGQLIIAPVLLGSIAACASPNDNDTASEEVPRTAAAPVLIAQTIPAGSPSGEISAFTSKTFRLSGKRDFVIEPGSRVDGRYELAYLPENERWQLSIDWYSLSAKGVSRLRNLGRRPPFYTQEEVVAPAGQSPELPEGATLPMRLFNLRDHNSDFDRIILLEE